MVNWRDILHPEAGGAELYVHSICSEFVNMGHDVCLYSSSFSGANSMEEIGGVKISRLGGKFSIYWAVYKQYIKDKTKYDVVLESINTIPFLMPLYAKQPVIALIYSITNRLALIKELGVTPISSVALLTNSAIPTIYRRSVIITISGTARRELIAADFDSRKIFVARPGVGVDFERLVAGTFEPIRPNFRIVYVGRLKKYKGIDVLLQAVAILRHNLPVELLIVGRGDYEESLRRQVAELGLIDCVHFTGFVSEAEKVTLLKSSSVFVCCSVDEGGWTIAGLEALRCGVPLVVTDSQRDLVQEGVTGFITPPIPEIIADKIRAILEKDWKSMSLAARRWSVDYTWKNAAIAAIEALKYAIERTKS